MFKGEFAGTQGSKAPPALLRAATSPLREELAESARPEGLYPPAFAGYFPVIHTI